MDPDKVDSPSTLKSIELSILDHVFLKSHQYYGPLNEYYWMSKNEFKFPWNKSTVTEDLIRTFVNAVKNQTQNDENYFIEKIYFDC